ncbi:BZ3501_MvSof-1269-A2-R1_Chr12-1g03374 [Microbotryum saponariae]|nr:BZ3501_MvSof-1269-A2-R1_Chr12-1g03374 [Microbotryum saponariae]
MCTPQMKAEGAPAHTPPNHGGPTANTSVNSDEWQLSVTEETSLIFDENDSSLCAVEEQSARLIEISESLPKQSPTPICLASSQQRSTSGPGRSPRPPQVQFSPLSLAPSPLLGLPPPPLPALIDPMSANSDATESPTSYRTQQTSAPSVRTILKVPGTPGTGRSVRFTSSARRIEDRSPTARPDRSTSLTSDGGSGEQERVLRVEKEEDLEEEISSSEKEVSSHLVASFLSRLQAVIPSPDSSLASPVSRLAGPGDQSVVEATSHRPAVAVTSPTSSDYVIDLSKHLPVVGLGIARSVRETRDLFDESNPFAGASISLLAASTKQDLRFASRPTVAQLESEGARFAPGLAALSQVDEAAGVNHLSRPSASDPPRLPPRIKSLQPNDPGALPSMPADKAPDMLAMGRDQEASKPLSCAAAHITVSDSCSNEEDVTPLSATSRASCIGSSLYRIFMQKRSEGSRIAADEWGRLVHGGQAGDKEPAHLMEGAQANPSLGRPPNLSPNLRPRDQCALEELKHSGGFGTPSCTSIEGCSSDLANDAGDHQLDDSYFAAVPLTYLSPIPELSEPNTTVESVRLPLCDEAASRIGRATPFRGKPGSLYVTSTTSSLASFTPEEHPSFALSLLPTSMNDTSSIDFQESFDAFASLVATYDVWREHTTAQKSDIASLLAIIRTECQRKDAVLAKLAGRNETLERQLQHITATLDETNHTLLDRDGGPEGVLKRLLRKNEALVRLVSKLTEELEARIQQQLSNKNKREMDLRDSRAELLKAQDAARDREIRLRVAQATQADLSETHSRMQQQVLQLVRENEALRQERDDARANWRQDVNTIGGQSDETVPGNEGQHSRASNEQAQKTSAANAAHSASTNVGAHKNAEEIASVRCSPHPGMRSTDELCTAPNTERGNMAITYEHANDRMKWMEHELRKAENTCQDLQARLLEATVRLEEQDVRSERFEAELKVKDDQIALHTKAWKEHQAEITRLMNSISLIEQEAVNKVHLAESELSRVQNELGAVIESKEQQLETVKNDISSHAARVVKLDNECKTNAIMVGMLRNRLAVREGKYTALKNLKAELESDILGLNIALEAKQQEASAWKRQVQSSRLSQMSTTTSKTTQNQHQASDLPRVAAFVGQTPLALTDGGLCEATPSQKGRIRKPSLGFGSSSRRDATSFPTLSSTPKSSIHLARNAGSKENVAPAFVRKRAASLILA